MLGRTYSLAHSISSPKSQNKDPCNPKADTSSLVCFITQYPNKNVALVASDVLHLLISHVDHLQKFPPDTPKKIVEVRHYSWHT